MHILGGQLRASIHENHCEDWSHEPEGLFYGLSRVALAPGGGGILDFWPKDDDYNMESHSYCASCDTITR